MSYSNRELVEFFIRYKLSQKNYPTSLLRSEGATGSSDTQDANKSTRNGLVASSATDRDRLGTPSSSAGGIDAVKAALVNTADRFEVLFVAEFSDLSAQLEMTPGTAHCVFKSVIDMVFQDRVNWGRIVGLFTFGGAMCLKCVEKGMGDVVPRIVDSMTLLLDEDLNPWIQSQGGWDCFAEMFGGEPPAAARRDSLESLKIWLLVGMGLLTGVLVTMFLMRRGR